MGISQATISGSYDDWGDVTSWRNIDRVAALLISLGAPSPCINRFAYTCYKYTMELQEIIIHVIFCAFVAKTTG